MRSIHLFLTQMLVKLSEIICLEREELREGETMILQKIKEEKYKFQGLMQANQLYTQHLEKSRNMFSKEEGVESD